MTNDILTQSPSDSSLAQHLLVMALGVAQTSVLCTAAQLGLADHLKEGPKSVAALAEATGTPPPPLTRLMGVLTILVAALTIFVLVVRRGNLAALGAALTPLVMTPRHACER